MQSVSYVLVGNGVLVTERTELALALGYVVYEDEEDEEGDDTLFPSPDLDLDQCHAPRAYSSNMSPSISGPID